ncbi:MAG: hypothetical protein QGF29_06330 [Verrucomicrobiota bacterium]|nr:hypothetical protein [Verrucomicrobiota bacterium]
MKTCSTLIDKVSPALGQAAYALAPLGQVTEASRLLNGWPWINQP